MNRTIATTFALCFFAATITTQAQAWTRYGGGQSCGKVVQSKDDISTKRQFKAWTFGFISAVNEITETAWQNAPDEEGVWQAVILNCQNNPLDNLYVATAVTWQEIMKRQ